MTSNQGEPPTIPAVHEREPGQRVATAGQAAEWDARYSERDGPMWSGRPNGRVVAEVTDVSPGRALDVGCGEGADAIWLARRGWAVTAIDISMSPSAGRVRLPRRPAPRSTGSAATPSRHRSRPARSTSCRSSTR